jgi:hypothetical protein
MKFQDVLKNKGIEDLTVFSAKTQKKIAEYNSLMANKQPLKLKQAKLGDLNDDILDGIADYFADITHKKRAEEAQAENQRLESERIKKEQEAEAEKKRIEQEEEEKIKSIPVKKGWFLGLMGN